MMSDNNHEDNQQLPEDLSSLFEQKLLLYNPICIDTPSGHDYIICYFGYVSEYIWDNHRKMWRTETYTSPR